MTYNVVISKTKNWYIATCKELPGLLVHAKDYETVQRNLPEAIAMLVKHETGNDVYVEEKP